MMTETNIVRIAKALSDKTRLRMLKEIADKGSITCSEVEKVAKLSQPTVSHHLKILYLAGLLNMEKNGRYVIFSVNQEVLENFGKEIMESVK